MALAAAILRLRQPTAGPSRGRAPWQAISHRGLCPLGCGNRHNCESGFCGLLRGAARLANGRTTCSTSWSTSSNIWPVCIRHFNRPDRIKDPTWPG